MVVVVLVVDVVAILNFGLVALRSAETAFANRIPGNEADPIVSFVGVFPFFQSRRRLEIEKAGEKVKKVGTRTREGTGWMVNNQRYASARVAQAER